MMRNALLCVVAFAALALVGCSAMGAPQSSPVAVSTRSATPTPTVHVMTITEAGMFYLQTVCPANKASAAMDAAFTAQNFAAVKQTATAAREAFRSEAAALMRTDVHWPASVSPSDIKVLVDDNFAVIAVFDSIANSTSLQDAATAANSYADKEGARAAAQRIRLTLNLPADTTASCANVA